MIVKKYLDIKEIKYFNNYAPLFQRWSNKYKIPQCEMFKKLNIVKQIKTLKKQQK